MLSALLKAVLHNKWGSEKTTSDGARSVGLEKVSRISLREYFFPENSANIILPTE